MEAYKHFGLNAPPFEGRPDPRFFHAAVAHAETLATLQYALHAGKSCTLVLGDSGSGKTLLGRVLLERSAGRATAAWMHGIGQPPGQTAVTLCSFGRPERPAPLGHGGPDESVLADWARTLPRSGHPTLLIVDNADGLRKDNWEDILALVTREIRAPRSLSLVLLGLPSLVDTLAGPGLVRLQRRLFRTCTVARLTAEEVAAYVRHRLTMAGGRNQQVFTPGALDLIHRFTDGNPALINQLCDNAMVDAFGEDRTSIDAPHVVATVQTITGGIRRRRYLPSPTPAWRDSVVQPVVPDEYRVRSGLRPVGQQARAQQPTEPTAAAQAETWERAVAVMRRPDRAATGPAPAEYSSAPTPFTVDRGQVVPPDCSTGTLVAQSSSFALPAVRGPWAGLDDEPLEERLRTLEFRLSAALSRVREARLRSSAIPQLPADTSAPADPLDRTVGAGSAGGPGRGIRGRRSLLPAELTVEAEPVGMVVEDCRAR